MAVAASSFSGTICHPGMGMDPTPEVREQFFSALGVRYSPHMVLHPDELDGWTVQTVLQSTHKGISESKPCLDSFEEHCHKPELLRTQASYGELVKARHMAPVTVQFIDPSTGYGCFALQDIPEHALIGIYSGLLSFDCFSPNRLSLYQKELVRLKFGGEPFLVAGARLVIDAEHHGNETRFINSVNSGSESKRVEVRLPNGKYVYGDNVEFKVVYDGETLHQVLVANRKIFAGEELRADYSGSHPGLGLTVYGLTPDGVVARRETASTCYNWWV